MINNFRLLLSTIFIIMPLLMQSSAGAATLKGRQTKPVLVAKSGLANKPPQEMSELEKKELALLNENLELQYQRLRKTQEAESVYSLALSEEYFAYGVLLKKLGKYDEAVEALINATFLIKVNKGIYSIDQLPVMKELFLTHYEFNHIKESEKLLERILWVEKQSKVEKDQTYYDLAIKVVHGYIDQFLLNPSSAEQSIANLLRAKHHINGILHRYKDEGLNGLKMPYGEKALVSFYQDQLHPGVDKTLPVYDPVVRHSANLSGNELALASYMIDAFPKGSTTLKNYLKKAEEENNLHHIVKAELMLGDFSLLFEKNAASQKYYRQAYESAKLLDSEDELSNVFKEVVPLPDFDYVVDRAEVLPDKPTVMVPLDVKIDRLGRVILVKKFPKDSEYRKYFSGAKRAVRRMRFRPIFVEGEAQPSDWFRHEVRVYEKK